MHDGMSLNYFVSTSQRMKHTANSFFKFIWGGPGKNQPKHARGRAWQEPTQTLRE